MGDSNSELDAFKELLGVLMSKLEEATPGRPLRHVYFDSARTAMLENAEALLASLKSSPTANLLVKQMSQSWGVP